MKEEGYFIAFFHNCLLYPYGFSKDIQDMEKRRVKKNAREENEISRENEKKKNLL